MKIQGLSYSVSLNRRFGTATITRLSDNKSAYLQGDDATEIESQLDALEATAQTGYPIGPFKSYEEHLDAILSAYDEILS